MRCYIKTKRKTKQKINDMSTQIFDSNLSTKQEIQWDGRILKFPVDMGLEGAVADRVMSARHVGAKSANAIIMFYFLMQALSPLREFTSADLKKIFKVSNNTVTKVIKVLEETGLVVIDKSEWYKAYGAGYEYMVINIPYEFQDTQDWLYYDLYDTELKNALDLYKAGGDVRAEVRLEEWNSLPEWCYESPYDELSYGFFTNDRLSESFELMKFWPRMKNEPVYKSGRIYHAFHNSKRMYRYGFMHRGSHITELFDLHASFFTLTAALKRNEIPQDEYRILIDDCFSGQFYTKAATALFGDNQAKDIIKDQLQAWRNCTIAQAHVRYPELSDYMERTYPTFSKIMYEWPTVLKEKNGKNYHIKTLQQEVGEYETMIFSKIALSLRDNYSVTPFLLHDAVYMSEADVKKLPADINEKILNWFKINILS